MTRLLALKYVLCRFPKRNKNRLVLPAYQTYVDRYVPQGTEVAVAFHYLCSFGDELRIVEIDNVTFRIELFIEVVFERLDRWFLRKLDMALIGILARIERTQRARIVAHLGGLPGVSLFPVGEEGRIGILVERDTLTESHAALKNEIETVSGLLAAWPVFSYAGCGFAEHAAASNTQSLGER
jgi:hypothetical protein